MPEHIPEDRLYHARSMWLKPIGENEAWLGITHFAQESLGNVVFVDLPRVGTRINGATALGTIESHKAVSDLIAPVHGTVVQVNTRLDSESFLLNDDPYGEGWVIRITLEDPTELRGLLKAQSYQDHITATT